MAGWDWSLPNPEVGRLTRNFRLCLSYFCHLSCILPEQSGGFGGSVSLLTILVGFAVTALAAVALLLAGVGPVSAAVLAMLAGALGAAAFAAAVILLHLRKTTDAERAGRAPIERGDRASLRQ